MNKILVPLFIVSLLFCGCSRKVKQAPPPPPPVTVLTTTAKNVPFYIDTLGHFAAFNTVTVQAQVQGELTGLYFEEGQPVNRGELLFTIDKRPYQAVLDKAVATLKQNEATLTYDLSRQERYSGLVEDDFVSKLQYTQYVTELESQEAIIQENQAEINSAAINVGFCSLTAPISGITGKRLVDVGNIITDVGTKMLVINQISPLFIDFALPERLFDAVHEMQQKDPLLIEVFVPNTSLVTHARLQMLDNTINPDTGMIALRGILANNDQLFWPQQFVRIRLIIDIMPNSIMIPPEAVVATSSGQIVWVVSDDETVCIQHVEIGEEYESELRVVKGLKTGQRIVTRGQLPLRPGIKVTIKKNDDELKS